MHLPRLLFLLLGLAISVHALPSRQSKDQEGASWASRQKTKISMLKTNPKGFFKTFWKGSRTRTQAVPVAKTLHSSSEVGDVGPTGDWISGKKIHGAENGNVPATLSDNPELTRLLEEEPAEDVAKKTKAFLPLVHKLNEQKNDEDLELTLVDVTGKERTAFKFKRLNGGGTKSAYSFRWKDDEDGEQDRVLLLGNPLDVGILMWKRVVNEELQAVHQIRALGVQTVDLQLTACRWSYKGEDDNKADDDDQFWVPALLSRDFASYSNGNSAQYVIDGKNGLFSHVPQEGWTKILNGQKPTDLGVWERLLRPAVADIKTLTKHGWSVTGDRANYILDLEGESPSLHVFMFDFASKKGPAWWVQGAKKKVKRPEVSRPAAVDTLVDSVMIGAEDALGLSMNSLRDVKKRLVQKLAT